MNQYTTTLAALRNANACRRGYNLIANHVGRNFAGPIPLETILDNNGLDDAIWALRATEGGRELAVAFAIYCAEPYYTNPAWLGWARKWMSGEDRTPSAAADAADAARAAARVAAYAADAARAAARAADVADVADAADAARAADAAYAARAAYAAYAAARVSAYAAADAARAAASATADAAAYAAAYAAARAAARAADAAERKRQADLFRKLVRGAI